MPFRRLFLLVEGDDDQRFFDRIVKPKFDPVYEHVDLWPYAQEKAERVEAFLKSIRAMDADYVFVTDLNASPCVSARKQQVASKYSRLEEKKIFVVVEEIESWYLAGLEERTRRKLEVPRLSNTDTLRKEEFNRLIPAAFDSRLDFMLELLNHFSVSAAKTRNKSFKYFMETYRLGN